MGIVAKYAQENLFKDKGIPRWTLKGIQEKDYGSLLCFLTDFAQATFSTQRFPSHCTVAVISTTVVDGAKIKKAMKFQVTGEVLKPLGPGGSDSALDSASRILASNPALKTMDIFEELISTPEKFDEVCNLLLTFANNNLAQVNHKINTLRDLRTGALFIPLIGITGQFFVPFNQYSIIASTNEQQVEILID